MSNSEYHESRDLPLIALKWRLRAAVAVVVRQGYPGVYKAISDRSVSHWDLPPTAKIFLDSALATYYIGRADQATGYETANQPVELSRADVLRQKIELAKTRGYPLNVSPKENIK